MKQIEELRCRLAVIAALLLDKFRVSNIYSYDDSSRHLFSVITNGDRITIYDYHFGCYLIGSFKNVYDYASSSYISITKHANNIMFYSFGFSRYINAQKNNHVITLYDYGDSSYHRYLV